MTVRADLIIVGAGLAGAAAARVAASRGLNVVVLEAFGPAHRNGSSHGSARIFRRAYPDPLYVRLTGQARGPLACARGRGGRGPARAHRRHRLRRGQGPGAAARGAGRVRRARRAAPRAGGGRALAVHRLRRRRPGHVPRRRRRARPRSSDRRDAPAGDRRRRRRPLRHPGQRADGNRTAARSRTTAGETFTAPVAVVAAGAWIAPLLAGLVELPPLTVTQQQVFHFAPAGGPSRRSRGRSSSTTTAATTATGCPAAATAGCPARSRSASTTPAGPPPPPARDFRIDPAARDRVRALRRQAGCPASTPPRSTRRPASTPGPRTRTSSSTGRQRPVRGRVALLRPRREVRPAARRDHRRPGRGQARPRPALHPGRAPRRALKVNHTEIRTARYPPVGPAAARRAGPRG